jgi:hypothetical protein
MEQICRTRLCPHLSKPPRWLGRCALRNAWKQGDCHLPLHRLASRRRKLEQEGRGLEQPRPFVFLALFTNFVKRLSENSRTRLSKSLRTAEMGHKGRVLAVLRYQNSRSRGHRATFQTVSEGEFSEVRMQRLKYQLDRRTLSTRTAGPAAVKAAQHLGARINMQESLANGFSPF